MKPFRFVGDALLRLRRNRLDQLAAAIAAIEAQRARAKQQLLELQSEADRAASSVAASSRFSGARLQALQMYRAHVDQQSAGYGEQERLSKERLGVLHRQLSEARRETRLLERLRERRLLEYRQAEQRENEGQAAELATLRWLTRSNGERF